MKYDIYLTIKAFRKETEVGRNSNRMVKKRTKITYSLGMLN